MKPILFGPTETHFDTNGLGVLSDTITAKVLQVVNGAFELEMQYPNTGAYAQSIIDRCIILAKPDPVTDPQPFRVYKISPASRGTMSVYARHIAYDTMGIPAGPFTAESAGDALRAMKAAASMACPFSFETDKTTVANMSNKTPAPIWGLLGGTEGSILDVYGGEWEFDGYKIILRTRRGSDRGVSIRYGKNLTNLEQERNCANCYTAVQPYWISTEGDEPVELPEKILQAEGDFNYQNVMVLDLSQDFQEKPTADQLRARAAKYIKENNIGVPDVSWKVEFVQLEQSEEYKGTALLERVLLGDTVTVVFRAMNVNASARAIETDFDPVLERYNSITLGRVKSGLADAIIKQDQKIAAVPTKTEIAKELSGTLAAAMGLHGGCVRLVDTNGDKVPDELYIADNADPDKAVKVWRWNYQGWAASKSGYNGPYTMGATLEDGLLADFVTAANLVAGKIKSKNENFFVDLDAGVVRIKSESTTVDGKAMVTSEDVDGLREYTEGVESELSSQIVANQTESAGLRMDAGMLSAEISRVKQVLEESVSDLNGNIQEVQSQVSAVMTPDAVRLEIEKSLDGVTRVKTSTGFEFNEKGLDVSKTGSEMSTRITEDGMAIKQVDETVLTASHTGVDAKNLHATTYMIIGKNSRMEDYGDGTGCFYIGNGG